MEPSFDAAAYVADLRRFVPLETLSAELEGHLTTLKNRVGLCLCHVHLGVPHCLTMSAADVLPLNHQHVPLRSQHCACAATLVIWTALAI